MRIGSRAWTGRGRQSASRHLVEPALVGHGLAIEQSADQPDRLVQPVEPLAEAAAEIDAERVVLPLEPAAAEAQDRPTARDVVERRRELGGQARGCGRCWR